MGLHKQNQINKQLDCIIGGRERGEEREREGGGEGGGRGKGKNDSLFDMHS